MLALNLFYSNYISKFYISKFLVSHYNNLFKIEHIDYNSDINKMSLVSMFWIYFILFGQLPKFSLYSKQRLEKISHGFIFLTRSTQASYVTMKKLTNFFLLSATTELVKIEKKTKSKINNIILVNNDYYIELVDLPRLYVEPFNISFTVRYTQSKMSVWEKIQVLRIFQIPVTCGWKLKKTNFRKKS